MPPPSNVIGALFRSRDGCARLGRISPLVETPPPLHGDPRPQVGGKLRERVLPVTGDGLRIRSEVRLDTAEVGQAQRLVDAPHRADRVGLQRLEADLAVTTLRDQTPLLEEDIVHLPVSPQDAALGVVPRPALEPGEPEDSGQRVPRGLIDGERVAVDVDEPRLGEQFQQESDPARVRGRLQEQRLAVLPGQLLQEQHEPLPPLVNLPLGDAPERQVAVVVFGTPGEHPADAGRAERHGADGELVLVGRVGGLADVIHRAGRREHRPDEPGGAGFGGQEGVRVRGLVDVRGGEPPVGGEQVVQVRRAAPPVAEDEHRRRHVHRHDLREVGPLLVAADGCVDEALRGDRLRPQPVGRVDGEPVLPQQAQPVPEGDTGEDARPDRLEDSFTPRHQGSRPVLRDHERR